MAAVIRPTTPKFNQARAERIMNEGMVTVRCPACGAGRPLLRHVRLRLPR
jgi:hypothetical protein